MSVFVCQLCYVFLVCLLVTVPVSAAENAGVMVNSELMEKIQQGQPPLVVDVRTGFEFRKGHVPGAVHMPFQNTFFSAGTLAEDKQQAVVLYCEHGPRAYLARAALKRAGFSNVVLLKGHMSAWKKEHLPTQLPENN